MKKTLIVILIIIFAVIILIGVAVGFYLGPIVKYAIEEIGPKVAKVSVTVDDVGLSILSGQVSVKGLKVGNPQGFQTPEAISVGNVAVSMDPMSALSKKVLVHSIQVQSPEITFEGGLSGNNLKTIANNAAASTPNPSASANASKGPGNSPAPNIEVDDLLIWGAKVHVHLTTLGGKGMTLPLPDIHLKDLGKDTNGMTPAELTRAVLDAITKDTVKTVTASVSQLGKGVQNILGSQGKNVGSGVNSIANKVGGFFGK